MQTCVNLWCDTELCLLIPFCMLHIASQSVCSYMCYMRSS